MRQIGIRHVGGSRLGDLVLAGVAWSREALGSMDPFIRVLGVVVMALRISCRASQCTEYVLAGVAGDGKNYSTNQKSVGDRVEVLEVWTARE